MYRSQPDEESRKHGEDEGLKESNKDFKQIDKYRKRELKPQPPQYSSS